MKRRRYDYSTSYNSSDFSSGELPATIGNIKSEMIREPQVNAPLTDDIPIPENLSEELQKALRNINSDEFHQLLERFQPDVVAYFKDAPRNVTENRYVE